MSKIVHVTTAHPWDDVRIFGKECTGLAENGYDVRLIAQGKDAQIEENLRVVQVPPCKSRVSRITRGTWAALRLALRERADLYHFHDPELIGLGLVLKALGRRVVYDAHEDVPKQILAKHWIPRPIRRTVSFLVGRAERLAAAAFDGIVAATPAVAERFPARKTVVVHNYAKRDELVPESRLPYAARPPAVAYVGAMCEERGIATLIDAVSIVAKQREARLLLAGNFRPASFEESVRKLEGWKHVEYWGQCSRADIAGLLGQSKVGVVTLLPTPNHLRSHPIKLYEYMSAGLPVVASDFPLWREIIESAECGLLVDPQRPEATARAITWLLDHPVEAEEMGRRGQAAVARHFNWESQLQLLLSFYDRLLAGRQSVQRRASAARSTDGSPDRKAA